MSTMICLQLLFKTTCKCLHVDQLAFIDLSFMFMSMTLSGVGACVDHLDLKHLQSKRYDLTMEEVQRAEMETFRFPASQTYKLKSPSQPRKFVKKLDAIPRVDITSSTVRK